VSTITHPEEARATRLAAIQARRDSAERLAAIEANTAAKAVIVTKPSRRTSSITTHDTPMDRPVVLRKGRTPERHWYNLVQQVGEVTVETLT